MTSHKSFVTVACIVTELLYWQNLFANRQSAAMKTAFVVVHTVRVSGTTFDDDTQESKQTGRQTESQTHKVKTIPATNA